MKKFLLSIIFLPLAMIAADTNALPPLAPAYPEMPPTFVERQRDMVRQHGLAASVIASSLSALVVGFLWQMFKPRQRAGPSAERIARQALEKLRNRQEDGTLLSEVSQILRRYVGSVCDFPAGEMTTAEFCDAVAQTEKLKSEFTATISSFLRECDVRKFSPVNSRTQVNAVEHAMEFVTQLENEFRKRDADATKP